MRTSRCLLTILLLLSTIWSTTARADLIVRVLDVNLLVGGSGMVDLEVSGENDLVQSFQWALVIEPSSPQTTSVLRFANPQSNNFRIDPDYLFFGNSDNQENGLPLPVVHTVNLPADTSGDNDLAFDGSSVAVMANAKLLARLNIEHVVPIGTDPTAVLGDSFMITVVSGATGFFDSNFTSINYTFTAGTVSLTTAAVPEPQSLALIVLVALATRIVHRWASPSSVAGKI